MRKALQEYFKSLATSRGESGAERRRGFSPRAHSETSRGTTRSEATRPRGTGDPELQREQRATAFPVICGAPLAPARERRQAPLATGFGPAHDSVGGAYNVVGTLTSSMRATIEDKLPRYCGRGLSMRRFGGARSQATPPTDGAESRTSEVPHPLAVSPRKPSYSH